MKKRRPFEAQLTQLSLFSSVPLLLLLLWVMVYAKVSIWLTLLVALIGGLSVIYTSCRIHQKSAYQFRSLSNLLEAMIQGDYSLRARSYEGDSALDELVASINGLAQRLSSQRTESVESQLLLRTVIEHIDVAIVALSEANDISFINPAAKSLLQLGAKDSNATLLKQLSVVQSFPSGHHQVVELSLGRQQGRFNVHVEEFRELGLQHKLLFITDVRTLLRSEERKSWQSLIRVISHEINNSLSPIASISQTLEGLVNRDEGNVLENKKDVVNGLIIITERANSLSQFVDSYKQLAKFPNPKKQVISVLGLCTKIKYFFENKKIIINSKEDISLFVDPVQFEQVLINLFKNSIEAMLESNLKGVIDIQWNVVNDFVRISIYDEGCGIGNLDNLFVPFYSTKSHGSGIGLVLCRQIVEAHGGYLTITNRVNVQGCCAHIEIPFNH